MKINEKAWVLQYVYIKGNGFVFDIKHLQITCFLSVILNTLFEHKRNEYFSWYL